MWTRRDLKERAKRSLKQSYLKALVVSVISMIVIGGFPRRETSLKLNTDNLYTGVPNRDDLINTIDSHIPEITTLFLVLLGLVIVIAILWTVFVANPIQVGSAKYFLESTDSKYSIDNILYPFKKGIYMNIVKTEFLKNLILFFFGIVTFIPIITFFFAPISIMLILVSWIPLAYMTYTYRQVSFILCDNPMMKPSAVLSLSKAMMDNHKFDTFVLDLSFILWQILAAFIPMIGRHLLQPYLNATNAELYCVLKDNDGLDKSEILDLDE